MMLKRKQEMMIEEDEWEQGKKVKIGENLMIV